MPELRAQVEKPKFAEAGPNPAGPFGPRVRKKITAVQVVTPQPYAFPAHPKLQQSRVLHRQVVKHPHKHVVQPEQHEQHEQHEQFEQNVESVQKPGKLRAALQSCFGMFA